MALHRKLTHIRAYVLPVVATAVLSMLVGCGRSEGNNPIDHATRIVIPDCTFAPVERSDGKATKIALLVGAGHYQHPSIYKLRGPSQDVQQMYALLTGPGGYGFPRNNVCRLIDTTATGGNFRLAMREALVRRARSGDTVVIYFSGHGTQLPDDNHDEPDLYDEALMLADARVSESGTLRDDEFALWLAPLRAQAGNVIVILDSCNSGSATRAFSTEELAVKYQPPREQDWIAAPSNSALPTGDGAAAWFDESVPGLVTLAAASDGTLALEKAGRGLFTQVLVSVLSQAHSAPLTYQQVARKVSPLLAANSSQVPMFTGDLDRVVFGEGTRTRPLALEVMAVGPPIRLGGTLMPGLGKNAELRVFDSVATGTDFNDPRKSKALLVVDTSTGLNAEAHVDSAPENAPAIAPGDLAVLVRPSDEMLAFRVRIRPAGEAGGIPTARASRIIEALHDNPEAAQLVTLSSEWVDFELAQDAAGRVNVIGPEGRSRNVLDHERSVVDNLWLHARQRAFLYLRGEGGTEFIDDQSLIVEVVGVDRVPTHPQPQSPCVPRGAQLLRSAGGGYIMPLCYRWQIKVSLAPEVRTEVRVGGVILSSDGSILGFPGGNQVAVLSPGKREIVFSKDYTAGPPLGVDDYLLVFGTKLNNPVDWRLLTRTARERSTPSSHQGPLHRALDRYLRGAGSRGQSEGPERAFEDSEWTRTSITLRVEANPAFEPSAGPVSPGSREYTVRNSDNRPYLKHRQRWHPVNMHLEARWRYRPFIADHTSGLRMSGRAALQTFCLEQVCRTGATLRGDSEREGR